MLELVIVTLAGVLAKLNRAQDKGSISTDEWADVVGDLVEVTGVIVRHLREQRKAKRAARG